MTLVELGGLKVARGGSGIAPGRVDVSMASTILRRLKEANFRHTPEEMTGEEESIEVYKMDRRTYAQMFVEGFMRSFELLLTLLTR